MPDDAYRGRRTLVLGASGFIGRWVARALARAGADVHVAARDPATAQAVLASYDTRAVVHRLDAMDLASIATLLDSVRPSVTFNLIGYGVDPAERDEAVAVRLNAEFVEALCHAVAETRDPSWTGQCLVHVGSAYEYGAAGGDLAEDTHPKPITSYGNTKLAGTNVVVRCATHLSLQAITARLFTVFGPGEHPGRLLPSLIDASRTGEPLALTAGLHRRDFTYVEDAAEGLLRLAREVATPGDIVNLATGHLTAIREFAEVAAAVLGLPKTALEFGGRPTRPEEMTHAPVSTDRLRQRTGWVPPTGIAEGIGRTLACLQGPESRPAEARASR